MGYRKYSDAEKTEALIALAMNKYNYEKTSTQLGISIKTLRRWDKYAPKNSVPELLNRAIERMLMTIPSKWNGQDWAIALGILIDKWLILQGEPTQRIESFVNTFEALNDDEKKAIIQEAQEFIASLGPSGVERDDKN